MTKQRLHCLVIYYLAWLVVIISLVFRHYLFQILENCCERGSDNFNCVRVGVLTVITIKHLIG